MTTDKIIQIVNLGGSMVLLTKNGRIFRSNSISRYYDRSTNTDRIEYKWFEVDLPNLLLPSQPKED